MSCVVCGKPKTIARQLCRSHYYWMRRRDRLDEFKTMEDLGATRKHDLEERLMTKIRKSKSGCWNWFGATDTNGYGVITAHPTVKRASRASYEHFKGPIPEGMIIRHTCDNKKCINPEHLILGSKRDNMLDAMERGQFRPTSSFTAKDILAIRSDPRTQTAIAQAYGVTQSTISRIMNGRRWPKLWKTD